MSENKKEKKEYLEERNYQDDLWQESYLVGQTKNTIRNTRQGQKEIRDNEKKKEQKNEEQ